jgi:diaminopimelate epimerase
MFPAVSGTAIFDGTFNMELHFAKWHGTGNDFILADDRKSDFPAGDLALIQRLCDRHLGIGSDGLILIQPARDPSTRFHMEFFNPDGSRSFCGNGSRCAYAFWSGLAGERSEASFTAIDGVHEAQWKAENVSVTLRPVDRVVRESVAVDFIQNGSPHELVWVDDPETVDLIAEGRRRRYDPSRGPGGTNVNFLKVAGGSLHMRTYERGVEDETLSCGTGVVAAALSALSREELVSPVKVITRGGTLSVEAEADGEGWRNIRLTGPVVEVYTGKIQI